ncbi:MAG: hypothetical protein MAG453_00321 [Calditrichaeota bacterium]|nr:hypothetical protein [Calditrichota bacterium]
MMLEEPERTETHGSFDRCQDSFNGYVGLEQQMDVMRHDHVRKQMKELPLMSTPELINEEVTKGRVVEQMQPVLG